MEEDRRHIMGAAGGAALEVHGIGKFLIHGDISILLISGTRFDQISIEALF